MNGLKYIFFDVGGVALLDFSKTEKWEQMLSDMCLSGNHINLFNKIFDEMVDDVCKGKEVEMILQRFSRETGFEFNEDYDIVEDFVNRFEPNPTLIDVVRKLKSKF